MLLAPAALPLEIPGIAPRLAGCGGLLAAGILAAASAGFLEESPAGLSVGPSEPSGCRAVGWPAWPVWLAIGPRSSDGAFLAGDPWRSRCGGAGGRSAGTDADAAWFASTGVRNRRL